MSIEALKENLHKQIDALHDATVLQLLHDAAVDYNALSRKDTLDHLTEEQKSRLAVSLQQAAEDNTVPHEEAMQTIRKWRNK